jgi:OPA family glycerol-3-phosphate transporter-like MFS transporter/OPA family sugar phosphate sensor protein UhpC-like MFS transporter
MAIVSYMVLACATAIFMMFVPHGSMLAIALLFPKVVQNRCVSI